MCCRKGDIFWAELGENAEGRLQAGARSVLIVSNDKANEHSPVITIIPITSVGIFVWMHSFVMMHSEISCPGKSYII